MPIATSTHIHAPIQTVWAHIEDPELQKQWMHGLISNELVGGERGTVGAEFKMLIKEGGKTQSYDGVLTACDAPHHLTVKFWGGCFKSDMKAEADYKLREADGGTRLDYSCDFVGEMGLFMKLLMPVFVLMGKMHMKKMMKSLKQHAEAGDAATTAA
ncbi:MAG: SRPBCC family protein [Phycisphaerales bacterium JB063]